MSSPPTTAESLQARIVSVELRSRQAAAPRYGRMSLADAVVTTLLVTVDVVAWCSVALRGARALVG